MIALCSGLVAARLGAQRAPATDSARVRGTVRTPAGQPAAGVKVGLVGTPDTVSTSDSGRFDFVRVMPGTYTLVAWGLPGAMARTTIIARSGAETRVDLVLTATTTGAVVGLPTVTVAGARVASGTPGPSVSPSGSNDYTITAQSIQSLPAGDNTTITDVLTQAPGVAIDQNQQIHIRNTEGPQFQYRIDGALVPLDINTNPPFISMFNPMFVSRMDVVDGILPSSYSYATGGVVDIQTKDGCGTPGGEVSALLGQRRTIEPSAQYAGCAGQVRYYVSGMYEQGETAFSSATPGPNPIHDETTQGQGFGYVSVPLGATARLSAILSSAASNNQLPNVADLPTEFSLAGVPDPNSASINSYLNFRDYLAMITLSGHVTDNLAYQATYSTHSISQRFVPDDAGELMFQGVASLASHDDVDNTLQGDLTYTTERHVITTGVYVGEYRVAADDKSLVFPVDSNGNQTSDVPITIVNNAAATNLIFGVYANDLWNLSDRATLNLGLRFDDITGFTNGNQLSPTINLSYRLTASTTLHGGFARYLQVPSFQGVSPTASAAFAGTTAEGPPGISTPLTEDDREWDVGVVARVTSRVTVSEDNYFEVTHHYLDTGQFGVVPIFAPFNYDHGSIWGSELAIAYRGGRLYAYGNATIGRNMEQGVVTGQFNFPPDELAYIDSHAIVLDHQPLYGASGGASYTWQQFAFSVDAIYSSGLRAGFADLEELPTVVQINAGAQRTFRAPLVGTIANRLTILNLLDRVNLIRPAEGIGIFQSAYGPRFTILDAVSIPFGSR